MEHKGTTDDAAYLQDRMVANGRNRSQRCLWLSVTLAVLLWLPTLRGDNPWG